jgi:uncharacterized damage-inducible protein DinB
MTLQEKLIENTQTLLLAVKDVSDEKAQEKPSATSWNILECLEHIFLVDVGVSKTLTVPAPEKIENNKTELFSSEKLNHILVNKRNDFKVPAPDFVSPKGKFASVAEATRSIEIIIEKIILHLNTNDISKETHTVTHPRLGEMTKTDWIHFLIAHTSRHVLQIKEIQN